MNTHKYLALLLFLIVSCGHNTFLTKSENKKESLFFNESMSRYTKADLENLITQKNVNVLALGQCYLGAEDKGLEQLKSKLNEHIIDEKYWNSVGVCYYLNKDYKEAAFFFKLSLQVAKSKNKTFSLPYNNLALIYIHTRQYRQALDYLNNAIKLNPYSDVAKFNLSQLYLKKYLPEKAKLILKKLLKKTPHDIDLQSSLGLVYLLMGDAKNALKMFAQLPKDILKRQDIASYNALAFFISGQYLETLEALKNQEAITIRGFRKIRKKLKELANAKIKQRGQS